MKSISIVSVVLVVMESELKQPATFGFLGIQEGSCFFKGTRFSIPMYSKSAETFGRYASITDSSSISTVTPLAVHIFENQIANYFSATLKVMLSNRYFQLIPYIRFLTVIPSSVVTLRSNTGLVINQISRVY
ncbi:hypothetical protein BDQ17DRAFT_1330410 [Cyathus striatus]|nr:hypothetical protein BDQ17DRAFT_1330410 [Cyathus striatus]